MDLTCCCQFPRNSAPLNESCKVLLHLLKDASLKERYNFPKKKQLFPDMCHFWHLDITKVMLRFSMCSEMQHYILQTSAVSTHGLPLKARLVQSFFCIYCIYYKEVEPFRHMPHKFSQCVRYSCKGVPHPFKDFPHR